MNKAAKKKSLKTQKSKTPKKKTNGKTPDAQRDAKTGASYDETPYESYAYPMTHPEHQAVISKLFGLTPPDLETARILELGCAGGGNILPLALDFPEAEFLGLDLSPIQIEEANVHKDNLGLKNIEFEALDIMDFGPDRGEFDYILCHGVFSWVPDFVREKILNICDKNLSKNGLACISYNVMPGWGPLRSVRDMMMMHTRKYEDPAKKVEQAKLLVEFLSRFMPQGSSMHRAVETVHEKFQTTNNDSYVLHEYLETNNEQFYFLEFAEMLPPHNLQYIGDSTLSLMHTGNLGPEADQALRQVTDTITKEQYIDFLSNRQFRFSILTHADTPIKGASLDVIDELYFSCDLQQNGPEADGKIKFIRPNSDFSIETGEPIGNALFKKMCETRYKTYTFQEMVNLVTNEVGEENKNTIEKALRGNIILYIFKNIIQPKIRPSLQILEVSEKPMTHPLTYYQASRPSCNVVSTANYAQIRPTPLEISVLRHMDGTNTVSGLVKKMQGDIESGLVTLSQNNTPITDTKQQEKVLRETVPILLENMAKSCLLVK